MDPMSVSHEERRRIYARLVREVLAGMQPNCYGKFSGQQIAYAKGRATQRFNAMGL